MRRPAAGGRKPLGLRRFAYDLSHTRKERGYSKDYRPDLKQMILGLVVDGDGRPICTEMWPGATDDVTTLLPVVDRLRQRFSIGRVCVVAARGMISAATIAGLEERKLEYILGARERSDAIVRKIVLENDDPSAPLLIERKAGETQLFVKQSRLKASAPSSAATKRRPRTTARSARRSQGNRISHCEEASEESVGTVGFFHFAADWDFGRFGVERVDRHVFESGEILWTVVASVAGAVLVHVDVEHPVEAVFDAPVVAGVLVQALGRDGFGEEIVGGLGRQRAGVDAFGFARAANGADGFQAGPAMDVLQPIDIVANDGASGLDAAMIGLDRLTVGLHASPRASGSAKVRATSSNSVG